MMCFFMMFPFKCLSDKYCGEIRKDEGLYERHQYLDQVNENGKRNGDGRETPAYTLT